MDNKTAFIRSRYNKYYVYVEYTDTETGKRKQKNYGCFEKKKDAEKHLIEIKSSINNNKFSTPSNITFVDRCWQYYNDEVKNFSPTTLKRSKTVINKHIAGFFKDTKLSDVTVSLYQKFVNHMYTQNLKVSTIKEILNKSDAALHECYRLREIPENIPDFIMHPKRIDSTSKEVYTIDESKKILSKVSSNQFLNIPIHLFLLGGLRFGEMAGLLWEDIDFKNNTLKIRHNLVYVNGIYYLRQTKTDGSTREISVPGHVMKLLKDEKIRQNKLKIQGLLKNEHDVVCINSLNKYWNNSSFTSAYKKFLNEINLRYINLHSLRHAHATMLILAGTDMKTVSERLGHTDIKMTMNTYSHVLKEMDKTASNNIEKVLL
ncbi:tyrosine-type recombinase/integrase [Paraclostridium tenue]